MNLLIYFEFNGFLTALLNSSFDHGTGAIFIVCLVVTSRYEFSWSATLELLAFINISHS